MHDNDTPMRTIYRDRGTGRFVPRIEAAAKPDETEIERVLPRHKRPKPLRRA